MTKNSPLRAATGYAGHRLYRHPFLGPQDPFSPDKTTGARMASVIPDTTVNFLVPSPDRPDTAARARTFRHNDAILETLLALASALVSVCTCSFSLSFPVVCGHNGVKETARPFSEKEIRNS